MKQEITFLTKKNCPKCEVAKELGEKLKDNFSIKYLPIETLDGLTEFTFSGFKYPPVAIFNEKYYNSMKLAEKDILEIGEAKNE